MVGEGLGLFYEDGPVFGDGHLAVHGGGAFAGFDADRYGELGFGAAAVDAVGGWDVGVVAADGGADVAIAGYQIVGGVEAYPA